MKNVVIANAFSINMIVPSGTTTLTLTPVDVDTIKNLLRDNDILSIVGHPDTAAVFSTLLNINIPMNRVSWKWDNDDNDDILIVGQLTGPRLPEGATTLPDGASITWWMVTKN